MPIVASTTKTTASATVTANSGLDLDLLGQPARVGVPAAGVDDGEGATVPVGVVGHAVAGHAGDVLDDRLTTADDAVDQRGLAHVGSSDDRDHGHAAPGRRVGLDLGHEVLLDEADDQVDDLVQRQMGGVDGDRAVGLDQRRGHAARVDRVALQQLRLGARHVAEVRVLGGTPLCAGRGSSPADRSNSPRPPATPPSRCLGPRRRCRPGSPADDLPRRPQQPGPDLGHRADRAHGRGHLAGADRRRRCPHRPP